MTSFDLENISSTFLAFEEKIIEVRRVTKVVKGGRKLSFRATVIIGAIQADNYTRVIGLGIGKAKSYNLAILNAIFLAKKNLVTISHNLNYSIPCEIRKKFGAAFIFLAPAPLGTGIIAGKAVRAVLELSGFQNIIAKQYGSSNLINNAKATILALKSLFSKDSQL